MKIIEICNNIITVSQVVAVSRFYKKSRIQPVEYIHLFTVYFKSGGKMDVSETWTSDYSPSDKLKDGRNKLIELISK